jgi:hypothetical protein
MSGVTPTSSLTSFKLSRRFHKAQGHTAPDKHAEINNIGEGHPLKGGLFHCCNLYFPIADNPTHRCLTSGIPTFGHYPYIKVQEM